MVDRIAAIPLKRFPPASNFLSPPFECVDIQKRNDHEMPQVRRRYPRATRGQLRTQASLVERLPNGNLTFKDCYDKIV
jgi:hypothetical protein